jgi:hypothetical protein
MVQVIVGADKKPFTFHKKLIRQHSEYFSRAFGSSFKEGEENTLYLAEADETSCLLFQSWIYLQTARSLHPVLAAFEENHAEIRMCDEMSFYGAYIQDLISKDTEVALRRHLIDLYIFADAYECKALRNDIMSAFMRLDRRSFTYMGFDVAPLVFESVPSSSTLCTYIVRSTAALWPLYHYDSKVMKSQSQEFVSELLAVEEQRRLQGKYRGDTDFARDIRDPCNFHEHAKDEEMWPCDSVRARGQSYINALISACMEVIDAQSPN